MHPSGGSVHAPVRGSVHRSGFGACTEPRRLMRALGVHEDVIVLSSRMWRTSATLVRSGEEAFLIDSPVFPDELELLPALAEQARFPVCGLLATHGDWDHLLGRLAFPGTALGVAETTAARLRAHPGAAQRELRDFDERHYLERPAPLALGSVDALPVPGRCEIGDAELELHAADGHTVDGMAVWIGWAGVLVCGDYLSPVEIPTVAALDRRLPRDAGAPGAARRRGDARRARPRRPDRLGERRAGARRGPRVPGGAARRGGEAAGGAARRGAAAAARGECGGARGGAPGVTGEGCVRRGLPGRAPASRLVVARGSRHRCRAIRSARRASGCRASDRRGGGGTRRSSG